MNIDIELQALIAEREGMIAENKQREYLGQAMAYVEDSFLILADKIRNIQQDNEPIKVHVHDFSHGLHCRECGIAEF
jgi:hypothetical protein